MLPLSTFIPKGPLDLLLHKSLCRLCTRPRTWPCVWDKKMKGTVIYT